MDPVARFPAHAVVNHGVKKQYVTIGQACCEHCREMMWKWRGKYVKKIANMVWTSAWALANTGVKWCENGKFIVGFNQAIDGTSFG